MRPWRLKTGLKGSVGSDSLGRVASEEALPMTIKNEHLEARRTELLQELAKGERRMAELDRERAELEKNMLRIAGAVQLLDELLSRSADPA